MNFGDPGNFINRELSWLDFNLRVLAEAEDATVPLLERLKFVAIVSSNLDEFFMVRVAMAYRALKKSVGIVGPDGMPAREIIRRVREKTEDMAARQYRCLDADILPALRREGLELVRASELLPAEREYLEQYFDLQVMPVLTPLAVDTGHPFPLLASGAVFILFKIKPRADTAGQLWSQADTVLVQVPTGLPRFVKLPAEKGRLRAALLDDVICLFADRLMGGGYDVTAAHPFRVTRDADLAVDEEGADDLMAAVEEELRSRRWGRPIRLEIGTAVDTDVVRYLQEQLGLGDEAVYRVPSVINLKSFFNFISLVDRPDLQDAYWPPLPHPAIPDKTDLLEIIRERDLVLHHPLQSFDPVVDFVSGAADDPAVLAIKITLYRVSGDSPLVKALVRAAENGKQVTALVELRARFDEEANITWARRLDSAGAHVIYGVVGYKTHSKVALVVRREEDGIRRYVHLSTGNYNDKTARVYTDLGYLTARPEFGADVSAFFNVITGYSLPPKWKRIEMAPTGLRRRFLALVEREIEKHSPETPGFIRAKMNALIDPAMIAALYRASAAGVRIELLVRGMCRLRAGVPGLSENIVVHSILDRFLEHSRIYHFRNGGNEEVYLASADWMERNFDRRLELLFPILGEENRREVLTVLDQALADNCKAWELLPDDTYRKLAPRAGEKPLRSQEALYLQAKIKVRQPPPETPERLFTAKVKQRQQRQR